MRRLDITDRYGSHFCNRRLSTPPTMINPDPSKARLIGSGVGRIASLTWLTAAICEDPLFTNDGLNWITVEFTPVEVPRNPRIVGCKLFQSTCKVRAGWAPLNTPKLRIVPMRVLAAVPSVTLICPVLVPKRQPEWTARGVGPLVN